MDTVSPVEVARRIGVSLPTAHAILDREGIARTGRGVERRVPPDVAERLIREHAAGYTASEIRVLAALAASPLGLSSARQVARMAGVSPTSAVSALTRLADRGLVRRRSRRTIRSGRVATGTVLVLDMRGERWPEVESAVRAVQLPDRDVGRQTRVPRAFWHLFWNADPTKLRLESDGAYVARRMLGSGSMTAAQWALQHIGRDDLLAAISVRGTDKRTAAMVRNWTSQTGSVAWTAPSRRGGAG